MFFSYNVFGFKSAYDQYDPKNIMNTFSSGGKNIKNKKFQGTNISPKGRNVKSLLRN